MIIDKRRILTNDPSMTAWGWAVLDAVGTILEVGAIKTTPSPQKLRVRKGDDRMRRVRVINWELLRVIQEHGVELLLCELPSGSQSASAAFMIGVVSGVMQTLADCLGIPVEWFSEAEAKKAVAGKRNASKEEIKRIINSLYEVPWSGVKWKDEAVSDALAIYYTASMQSEIFRLFINKEDYSDV